jgi:hypothetical protein
MHCEEGWRLYQPANCGKVVSTKVGCGRFDGKYSRAVPGSLQKESLMTAPIPENDHISLLARRSILIGAAASLLCAPAIVQATNLMPVRRLPFPYGPQYAGYVERLYLHSLESQVRNLKSGQTSIFFNNQVMAVDNARRHVAFAQAHGFLPPYICIYRKD